MHDLCLFIKVMCNIVCVLFQIAGVLTLPFDVIKTHRQIELGELEFTKGTALLHFTS